MAKQTQAQPTKSKSKSAAVDLAKIQTTIDNTVTPLANRNTEFDKYEKMYLLTVDDSTGQSSRENVKSLYDPHPHNSINALVNTYTSVSPRISVRTPDPKQRGLSAEDVDKRKKIREAAEKAERFLKALLYRSNEVTQRDLVASTLKAMALFAEGTITIDNAQAEEPDAECPFAFDVPHPKLCYPRYSRRKGLLGHVVKLRLPAADIRATYGDKAVFITEADETALTLVDYIGISQDVKTVKGKPASVHVVYVEEHKDQAIINASTELPFVPRVSVLVGSNDFFEAEENRRVPFLFALLKSGTWAARNLQLTVMNDNLVKYLNSPIITHTRDGQPKGIDFSKPYQEIAMYSDENANVLLKNVVPTEQLAFLNITGVNSEESTLPKVAMGSTGAIGTGAPAAAIASLSANARIATRAVARGAERALSKAFSTVLKWIIATPGLIVSAWGANGVEELAGSDLIIDGSEYTEVLVELQPDMQQERQMVAGLAATLFNSHLVGYDIAGEILESGGVVNGAQEMLRDVIERAFIEARLPAMAQQAAQQADKLTGYVAAVPSAPSAGAPPGTMPGQAPSPQQLLGALQASGAMSQPPALPQSNPIGAAMPPTNPADVGGQGGGNPVGG